MGLLVSICGSVESCAGGYFFVDDGSGYEVKVYSSSAIEVGDFVKVVGIAAYEINGGPDSIRVVKTRSSADVNVLQ